jgi:hypothetical protein
MASKIDPKLAKSLIQEFRNQNKSAPAEHAWKTPDGQHLHGFFINRESLEDILKDKENVGVHVYLAKHPDFTGKPDKVHTIALTGAKPNMAPNATTPYVNDGDVYDMIPPCPPVCGTM